MPGASATLKTCPLPNLNFIGIALLIKQMTGVYAIFLYRLLHTIKSGRERNHFRNFEPREIASHENIYTRRTNVAVTHISRQGWKVWATDANLPVSVEDVRRASRYWSKRAGHCSSGSLVPRSLSDSSSLRNIAKRTLAGAVRQNSQRSAIGRQRPAGLPQRTLLGRASLTRGKGWTGNESPQSQLNPAGSVCVCVCLIVFPAPWELKVKAVPFGGAFVFCGGTTVASLNRQGGTNLVGSLYRLHSRLPARARACALAGSELCHPDHREKRRRGRGT